MNEAPHLTISRVFDAPRALVFQAFTDPVHLASWWGPSGHSVSSDGISFDVRPGGFLRWTEVAVREPDLQVQIRIDLTNVIDGDLLEGFMHVLGRLQDGVEPFDTRFRIEFHEASAATTRLEISQWLPVHLAGPTSDGWSEAFDKLDTTLLKLRNSPTHIKE